MQIEFNINEYITGERLQEIADHSIVFEKQIWLDLLPDQLKNTKCTYTYIKDDEVNDNILKANIIFVYTHGLKMFFEKIFPKIDHPITLISHNSDKGIDASYKLYLDDPKIKNWFAENVGYTHPKLIPIPIGIANSQWSHGNLNIIEDIRTVKYEKDLLVYKNFNVSTSVENRYAIDVITTANGIPMNASTDNRKFLSQLARSAFCICPFGSGYDSHRVWEALYMRTVPIVPNCVHFQSFSDLPIILVDDWNTITLEYLTKQYKIINSKKFNFEKLFLSYWRQRIKST